MAPSKDSLEGCSVRADKVIWKGIETTGHGTTYYARGLLDNGINPTLYIPALYEAGKYETDAGVAVRFLPLARWYRPFEQVWFKRLSRLTRWSLYAEERINTIAFMGSLRKALAQDGIDLLYIQEYWSGRFDHIVHRVSLPVAGADHGGVSKGVVKLFKPRAFKKMCPHVRPIA